MRDHDDNSSLFVTLFLLLAIKPYPIKNAAVKASPSVGQPCLFPRKICDRIDTTRLPKKSAPVGIRLVSG